MTTSFTFTKTLSVILIANLLVFITLYAFQLPSSWLLALYPLSCVLAYLPFHSLRLRGYPHKKKPLLLLFLVIIFALLTLPRIGYLTDILPQALSALNWDDEARLAHLISMYESMSYPLKHFANPDYLFSYYYASYYPWIFAKLCLPFISLKTFITLGNALYHSLILGSLFELSKSWFSSRKSRLYFLYILIGFSGFDWVMNTQHLFGHSEWWQLNRFNANTQISSIFTGLFWCIHHIVGLISTVIAATLFFKTKFRSKRLKLIVSLSLLISAFYASPFSLLAAPLFALTHFKLLLKRVLFQWPTYLIVSISLLPLPLFLNKPASIQFIPSTFRVVLTDHFLIDKLLSFPLFLTLVPFIEMAGIPLLLGLVMNKMSKTHKHYFISAWAFFLLTYVVALSGFNVLSMRGMLLPYLVFIYLFALYSPHLKESITKTLITLILIGSVLGITRDASTLMQRSLGGNTLTFIAIPSLQNTPSAERSKDIVHLVQNPSILKAVKTTPKKYLPTISPYQAEVPLNKHLDDMNLFELEGLRLK